MTCEFCGQFFAPTPTTTYCRDCYYAGKTHERNYAPFLTELRAEHAVRVEHTGGGCFCVIARLENGHAVVFTEAIPDEYSGICGGDPVLPTDDAGNPTPAGPWYAGHYEDGDGNWEVPLEIRAPLTIAQCREFLHEIVTPEWAR